MKSILSILGIVLLSVAALAQQRPANFEIQRIAAISAQIDRDEVDGTISAVDAADLRAEARDAEANALASRRKPIKLVAGRFK